MRNTKMYELELTHSAQEDLTILNSAPWKRVEEKLLNLRENPRPPGYVQLQGGAFRIEAGEYKILYDIDDTKQLITVLRVKHNPNFLAERNKDKAKKLLSFLH